MGATVSLDHAAVAEKIRQFLLGKHWDQKSADTLMLQTQLRTNGLLDSLGAVGLVIFIEDEFGIELAPHELGVESFNTILDMAALVCTKLREKETSAKAGQ